MQTDWAVERIGCIVLGGTGQGIVGNLAGGTDLVVQTDCSRLVEDTFAELKADAGIVAGIDQHFVVEQQAVEYFEAVRDIGLEVIEPVAQLVEFAVLVGGAALPVQLVLEQYCFQS